MPEELPPEFKLYVKEEMEQLRKSIKEDVEKSKISATRTFSTVAGVVGLLTVIGAYGAAMEAIRSKLEITAITELEKRASESVIQIGEQRTKAEEQSGDISKILEKLKEADFEVASGGPSGYVRQRDVTLVWGEGKSNTDDDQEFYFAKPFEDKCFFVVTNLGGQSKDCTKTGFKFNRINDYGDDTFQYLAIGK